MSTNNSNVRARNWCAVIYPTEKWYRENCPDGAYDGEDGWGSAPDDWKSILDNLNIKWACSPLHDKDVDDDGVIKKPHWHIVMCYSGNKSFDQVRADLTEMKCPIPQICRDVRSSVRYFIHKDHPHKYQYLEKDIESYGGFDVGDVFKFSKSESDLYIREMADFIEQNDIIEFFDFDKYCREEKTDTWYRVLTDSKTIYFKTLIASNRHRKKPYLSDNEE